MANVKINELPVTMKLTANAPSMKPSVLRCHTRLQPRQVSCVRNHEVKNAPRAPQCGQHRINPREIIRHADGVNDGEVCTIKLLLD